MSTGHAFLRIWIKYEAASTNFPDFPTPNRATWTRNTGTTFTVKKVVDILDRAYEYTSSIKYDK